MSNSSLPQPDRVAIYVRMSTAKQEDSPERQLGQLLPHAEAKGYKVVETYQDLGVAGDELERRPSFRRLLADAKAGRFGRILVDSLSRLGRFDALKWGAVLDPLRAAGVAVETLDKGELKWNDLGGRLMTMIDGEQRHGEQRNLSYNTLTGMMRKAAEGRPLGGRAPYGYRWEGCPERGRKLTPDGHKAEAVRLIFQWAAGGHSLRWIAGALRERGIANPEGREFWHSNTVKKIIENRRYVGDLTWGAVSSGKFWGFADGRPAERDVPKRRNVRNATWQVKADAHDPLIDRETFAAAQAGLRSRKGRTTPLRDGGDFLLCKLLTCGHCGSHLLGTTREHKGRRYRVYRCGGYVAHGPAHCRGHNLREEPLVRLIVRSLRDAYLAPDRLEALRAEWEAQEADRTSEAARKGLRKRIDQLARDIDKASGNLALTGADLRPLIEAKLRQMIAEKQEAEASLQAAERARGGEDFDGTIENVRAALLVMESAMEGQNAPLLRQAIREWVVRVECLSEVKEGKGGKQWYKPAGGTIVVRRDTLLGCLLTSPARREQAEQRIPFTAADLRACG